jgi:DNA-binding transcriptional LysR family regulator
MIPSPAELTYFYEIASASNLTRASTKLGMSQPSLSLAIKRLEKSVGTALFVRHKQGVTLTPAGKKLLQQVKPLLQHWHNTKFEAKASHQEIQGEITLGCHTTIALFLHGFLSGLLIKHPKMTFHLKHDSSQKTTENVINSSLDIGIVTNPFKHPDLIIRKLNSSETTFWTGNNFQTTQDLHSDKLVLICDPNIPQTHLLLKKWKNSKLNSARVLTTNSLEIVANLTANGCGIGILPSCFTQSIYPDKLIRVPNTPVCYDDLYLIYRKENRDVKAIETVISAIKNNSPH